MPEERLYGLKEIAGEIGVRPATLSAWRARDTNAMPPPNQRLSAGPVWFASRIEPWIVEQRRHVEMPEADVEVILRRTARRAFRLAAALYEDSPRVGVIHRRGAELAELEGELRALGGSGDPRLGSLATPLNAVVVGVARVGALIDEIPIEMLESQSVHALPVAAQEAIDGVKEILASEMLGWLSQILRRLERRPTGPGHTKELDRDQEQRARAGRLLPRLLEAEALELGQTLYFRRDAVPESAPVWSVDAHLYRASLVAGEGNRTLEWIDPDTEEVSRDSPSFLAARLLHRLGARTGEVSSDRVNGMLYWTVDGNVSLRDLAADAGILQGSSRHIDRELLHRVCQRIPAGRWITYGDIAKAIGMPGAAQSVAGVIATDETIPHAHRVLRSGGRISPRWVADEGGPEVARARLSAEGIIFGADDAASPSQQWSAADAEVALAE